MSKKVKYIALIFTAWIMLMLMLNPVRSAASLYDGLVLYVKYVLPSMFPFFFLTGILTKLGGANILASIFCKPVSKIYNAPSVSSYVMLMSYMCGYPVGAKLISDLYTSHAIDSKQACKMNAFSSTSGPLFIVGSLGAGLLGNAKYGYLILLSHVFGAMFNGLIYRGKNEIYIKTLSPSPTNYDNILKECVYDAIISVLIVGGYIAIFSMLVDLLRAVKICDLLIIPLSKVFAFTGNGTQVATAVVYGFIEMTQGVKALSGLDLSPAVILAIATFIISFGGLSVTMQSITFLSTAQVKTRIYLLQKLTQGIISALVAFLLGLFI